MDLGWKGKRVQHQDGRQGVIAREDVWFGGVDLIISTGDGGTACVKLNTRGQDAGETGWSWWCENFSNGACWLPLGDHN